MHCPHEPVARVSIIPDRFSLCPLPSGVFYFYFLGDMFSLHLPLCDIYCRAATQGENSLAFQYLIGTPYTQTTALRTHPSSLGKSYLQTSCMFALVVRHLLALLGGLLCALLAFPYRRLPLVGQEGLFIFQ